MVVGGGGRNCRRLRRSSPIFSIRKERDGVTDVAGTPFSLFLLQPAFSLLFLVESRVGGPPPTLMLAKLPRCCGGAQTVVEEGGCR